MRSPIWAGSLTSAASCALLLPLVLMDPVLSWGYPFRPMPQPVVVAGEGRLVGPAAPPRGGGAGAAEGPAGRTPPPPPGEPPSSFRLEFQPTSLLVLADLGEVRLPARATETFGAANMELVRAVEESSEPGDLVFVQNGILGDFIYAMTGRYATRGMFHEVRPEDGKIRPEEADLAVFQAPAVAGRLPGTVPAGTLLSQRGWSTVCGAGPYLVLQREVKKTDDEEVKAVESAIPMWLAYLLASLAALVVMVDAWRRKPREEGGGWPHGLSPETGGQRTPEPGTALVLVPAWDEEGSVGGVVREVRETCPGLDVLVLDDGSTDGTSAEALEAGAMVLRSERKLGLGEMLRRGMAFALENGYQAALRLDGDGQHPATYATSLLWPVFN